MFNIMYVISNVYFDIESKYKKKFYDKKTKS